LASFSFSLFIFFKLPISAEFAFSASFSVYTSDFCLFIWQRLINPKRQQAQEARSRKIICFGLSVDKKVTNLLFFFKNWLTLAGKMTNLLSTFIWLKMAERSEANKREVKICVKNLNFRAFSSLPSANFSQI